MALLDSLRSFLVGRPTPGGQIIEYVGPTALDVLGMSPATLFRTQSQLRTVVTFLCRNIAQLPLPVYERVSDTDRRKDSGALARLLKRPNPEMTTYDLIYALVGDYLIYDEAYWLISGDPESGEPMLYPLPVSWVESRKGGSAWGGGDLVVVNPKNGERTSLSHGSYLHFHGWTPGDPSRGTSPVESLKEILAEQIQAWSYRQQVWTRGGRVGAYLTRPATAAAWSPEAQKQFMEDWKSQYSGQGPAAGSMPILQDGMSIGTSRFNAREEEWSEVAKLSLATVAGVYHTSPTMVGILDNANFSNVKEFSRMLYTDTLGPYLTMIESRINAFLVPIIEPGRDLYVEFNIAAKMAGSFEEQAAVLSTSVGRPWMTADEARGRMNMPALGGDADSLVTPLNVLVGGQASPRDSGSQNQNATTAQAIKSISRTSPSDPIKVKASPREQDERAAAEVLRRFFKRQRGVVLSRLGAKAEEWWDEKRWNDELTEDLYALAMTVSEEIAVETLDALGFGPDQYSTAQTVKFLRAVAESRAGAINSTTRDQIKAALSAGLDEGAEGSTPAGVFDLAESSRADQGGLTLATTLAAFAATEAGKQTGRPGVTKTWLTASANPRPSHAAMDGETVGVDEKYSNGMEWPGDSAGGVDEIAGCSCVSELTIP